MRHLLTTFFIHDIILENNFLHKSQILIINQRNNIQKIMLSIHHNVIGDHARSANLETVISMYSTHDEFHQNG